MPDDPPPIMTSDPSSSSLLLSLPAELIQSILSHLDVCSLGSIAQTCRRLGTQSCDDQIWQPLVNAQLPRPIPSPAPCRSWRDLYLAHHPYWFLARGRVWFGDSDPTGKLIVARYDPARGVIEAHSVVATRGNDLLAFWEKDPRVIIHRFHPDVRLDTRQPVLQLEPGSCTAAAAAAAADAPTSSLPHEILMGPHSEERLYSSLLLTRTLPGEAIFDNTLVWPPPRFPSPARTRNDTQDYFLSAGHRPTRLSELSESTFRIRRWVEYASASQQSPHPLPSAHTLRFVPGSPRGGGGGAPRGTPSRPTPLPTSSAPSSSIPTFATALLRGRGGGLGFRPPEFVTTFATIPASARTPTPEKPFQGVWCGDYSGHGCEFLLITQPDASDARPLPEGMDWLAPWFSGQSGAGNATPGQRQRQRRGSEGSDGSFVSAVEDLDVGGDEGAGEGRGGEVWGQGEGEMMEGDQGAVGDGDDDDEEEEVGGDEAGAGLPFTLPRPGRHSRFRVPAASATDFSDVPAGRLEAIKLTGDPNVPRGEYTFIAPEIGHGGFLRVADEEPFRGARVVRSAGHIAGRGFIQDQYTPSQLIMVSHDELAQFWEGFGHISFYKRVDLDALIDGST